MSFYISALVTYARQASLQYVPLLEQIYTYPIACDSASTFEIAHRLFQRILILQV